MVEMELGVPFEDVYELVEPEPIAAASIGQASCLYALGGILVPSCSGSDSVLLVQHWTNLDRWNPWAHIDAEYCVPCLEMECARTGNVACVHDILRKTKFLVDHPSRL